MKRWWVSWHHNNVMGEFELHTPWWISGYSGNSETICAAVIAETKDAVREKIFAAYDERPKRISWRFIEPRPDDWKPWVIPKGTSRFQKADWMKWPD